ncbi:CapA family protein [Butyrivibrio sp. M55]|uniref:CapA family protein n=1 Tax=Butyrivibrio sp. M55 TaxID=1855323 RepID=UPI0008F20A5F|nr:CapA family protein [Butyrivibrio sp. M55]SFU83783.1 capsule synthesis protein PGA_cap [Butyrivibrio sp. M55]
MELIPEKFKAKKVIMRLLPFFGIAVAVCVIFVFVRNNYIPAWIGWNDKEMAVYGDENASPDEGGVESSDNASKVIVKLGKKKLEVVNSSGETTFISKKDFKVQDVLVTDIDRDGDNEMIVLLWKHGKYGMHKPFWVEKDEKNYSQHVFIYDVDEDGKVTEKWCASDMGLVAGRIKLMEKNNSIFMMEDKDKNCTLWMWEGWGVKTIDNKVRVVAFGDNLIHEPIYEYARNKEKGEFDFLYEPFLDEIQSADIAALNAETVLVDKDSMVGGYPSFGSPSQVGEAIRRAGFDVVSCANNHALDRGIQGIDTTVDFYKDAEITCVGIQNSTDTEYRPYELISRNGMRIALFSYTYGTNVGDISGDYPNVVHYLPGKVEPEAGKNETASGGMKEPATNEQENKLISDIQSARKEADFVIVFVHWGEEYQQDVTEEQKHIADLFAQGGADVVIGTHPHVIQKTETMNRPDGGKMLVYYSLGNFRADQAQSEETKRGAEAAFTIAHTYDGVALIDYETKEIDAYWK